MTLYSSAFRTQRLNIHRVCAELYVADKAGKSFGRSTFPWPVLEGQKRALKGPWEGQTRNCWRCEVTWEAG